MDLFELLERSEYPGCWQTDIDFNRQDLPIGFIDDVRVLKGLPSCGTREDVTDTLSTTSRKIDFRSVYFLGGGYYNSMHSPDCASSQNTT